MQSQESRIQRKGERQGKVRLNTRAGDHYPAGHLRGLSVTDGLILQDWCPRSHMNNCNFRPCVWGRREKKTYLPALTSHWSMFTSWDNRPILLTCISVALSRSQNLSCFSFYKNRRPRAGGKSAWCNDKRCCLVVPTGNWPESKQG